MTRDPKEGGANATPEARNASTSRTTTQPGVRRLLPGLCTPAALPRATAPSLRVLPRKGGGSAAARATQGGASQAAPGPPGRARAPASASGSRRPAWRGGAAPSRAPSRWRRCGRCHRRHVAPPNNIDLKRPRSAPTAWIARSKGAAVIRKRPCRLQPSHRRRSGTRAGQCGRGTWHRRQSRPTAFGGGCRGALLTSVARSTGAGHRPKADRAEHPKKTTIRN